MVLIKSLFYKSTHIGILDCLRWLPPLDSTLKSIASLMSGDPYGLADFGAAAHQRPNTDNTGPDGPLIFDIGANVGDFSVSAALLYPNAQVVTFEPAAETFFNGFEYESNLANAVFFSFAFDTSMTNS